MPSDVWPLVHAERRALADDLGAVTREQWATPSLCARWTVLDVLGHMTATAKMTTGRFITSLAGSGFSFDAMVDKALAVETAHGPSATLAEFRANISQTTCPPGPKPSWLGETVLHAEDIRRPLGLRHDYDPEAVIRVADFYKGSNVIVGAKRRINGVRLSATDVDWSTGSGAEVTGPILALTMVMTGRGAALEDCAGPGLDTLRQRLC